MNFVKEMRRFIQKAGDNCMVCGEPFLHGAPTYIGTIKGELVNVSTCCSAKLSRVDASGTYYSRNPEADIYDAPYKQEDKEWFDCHPDRSYHIRRAHETEVSSKSWKRKGANTFVVVHQIGPGHRMRLVFVSESVPEDIEEVGQEIFTRVQPL